MNDAQINGYVALLGIAITMGSELVDLIRDHAAKNLTPEEFQQLESRWNADVAQSALDAGIDPEPDVPLGS